MSKSLSNYQEDPQIKIIEQRVKLYADKLEDMNEEELGYEFGEVVGNECRDFQRILANKERAGVIEYLLFHFEDGLLSKPLAGEP